MKKLLCITVLVILTSCSSYHTFPNFYERYKESPKVDAYQLPEFKEQVMDSFSPYTRNLLLDVTDLRYLKLKETNYNQNELVKIEIRGLFKRRFKDLQRVVTNDSLKIVAMKVTKGIATEFLVFQNKDLDNTMLYLAGDMDPLALTDFFETNEHNKMIAAMLPENFDETDSNLKELEEKKENNLNNK